MTKFRPDEVIIGLGGLTIGDFWSWAYSDIMNNRNRSIFAEFIVGSALGAINKPRIEWDAFDLVYRGKKIEVKSSAYLQSWPQSNLSLIRFDIATKRSWYADSNTFETEPVRAADCYVFCIFSETDPIKADVLNMEKWQFYVLATAKIDRELGVQKTIGIKRLQSMCNPIEYGSLKTEIDHVVETSKC